MVNLLDIMVIQVELCVNWGPGGMYSIYSACHPVRLVLYQLVSRFVGPYVLTILLKSRDASSRQLVYFFPSHICV